MSSRRFQFPFILQAKALNSNTLWIASWFLTRRNMLFFLSLSFSCLYNYIPIIFLSCRQSTSNFSVSVFHCVRFCLTILPCWRKKKKKHLLRAIYITLSAIPKLSNTDALCTVGQPKEHPSSRYLMTWEWNSTIILCIAPLKR